MKVGNQRQENPEYNEILLTSQYFNISLQRGVHLYNN